MQNMDYFLAARALSLCYEARQFPQTAPVARAWLLRAELWALKYGFDELAERLSEQIKEVEEPCVTA